MTWMESDEPTPQESALAWDAATNFPMRSFRANAWFIGFVSAGPPILYIALRLDLPWTAVPVLLLAAVLPVAYATVLNYFTAELLMRPVVEDIARVLPEDFEFNANGLLLRKRLKIVLPVFTCFVGLIVAALMTGERGTDALLLSVIAAVGVGLADLLRADRPALALGDEPDRRAARRPRARAAKATSRRASRSSPATSSASSRTASTRWPRASPSASACARRSAPTWTATSPR